jgi:hypothetical protein
LELPKYSDTLINGFGYNLSTFGGAFF